MGSPPVDEPLSPPPLCVPASLPASLPGSTSFFSNSSTGSTAAPERERNCCTVSSTLGTVTLERESANVTNPVTPSDALVMMTAFAISSAAEPDADTTEQPALTLASDSRLISKLTSAGLSVSAPSAMSPQCPTSTSLP